MAHFKLVLTLAVFTVLTKNVRTQTIDEMIVNSATTSREFEFFYDEGNNIMKVEYDILLSYDEYNTMFRSVRGDNLTRKKRAIGKKHTRWYPARWSSNTVHYEIMDYFSTEAREAIRSAIEHWQTYTCLNFVEDNEAENRIQFMDGGGCYSRIGMVGGLQPISLSSNCRLKHIIIHEIGHAVGLYHEQSHPDRDDYVAILMNNIAPDRRYNFQKLNWNALHDPRAVAYDYSSIMHYGKMAFSVNDEVTIRTRDPQYQDVIGNARTLSFVDIKTVNAMYNCRRTTWGCHLYDCPGSGFVGKDCTCWCSGDDNTREGANPVRPCNRPRTPRPPTPRPTPRPSVTRRPTTSRPTTTGCRDRHTRCSDWATAGECDNNPGYMHTFCKQSCRRCEPRRIGTTPPCEDKNSRCRMWQQMGFCTAQYQNIVKPQCKKSCGVCMPTPTRVTSTPCEDSYSNCQMWHSNGYCDPGSRYQDIARTRCKRSCGVCRPTSEPEPVRECSNSNNMCGSWARYGECTRNQAFMLTNCRLACNVCSLGADGWDGHQNSDGAAADAASATRGAARGGGFGARGGGGGFGARGGGFGARGGGFGARGGGFGARGGSGGSGARGGSGGSGGSRTAGRRPGIRVTGNSGMLTVHHHPPQQAAPPPPLQTDTETGHL